jgi:hypothetical protein
VWVENSKELILSAGFEDAVTTLIFTGRPLHVWRTDHIEDWYIFLCALPDMYSSSIYHHQEPEAGSRDKRAHRAGEAPA